VVKAKSFFLILKGTPQTHTKKETIRTRPELNALATLLTRNIPILCRVEEKTRGISIQTECFVVLYDRASLIA